MIERKLYPGERSAIEEHVRYISDDSTIAAYHNIPRGIVAMIRAQVRKPKSLMRSNLVLPPRNGDCEDGEYRRRKTDAETANEAHLRALLHYGAKYGLPNIAPETCAERLAGL